MIFSRYTISAVFLAASVTSVYAQAANTSQAEPFFKITTTVPDAIGNEDGTRTGLTLEYFVDPSGQIADVAFSPKVEATGLTTGPTSACKAKCFKTKDTPPRQFCMVNAGCGGQGGGGTLFVAPVLVEFTPKPGGNDAAIAFDINVFDFGAMPESRSVTSEVTLPEAP